jgi:hypothetical protein
VPRCCLYNTGRIGRATLLNGGATEEQCRRIFTLPNAVTTTDSAARFSSNRDRGRESADVGFLSDVTLLVRPSDSNPSQINTTDAADNSRGTCSHGQHFELLLLQLRANVR